MQCCFKPYESHLDCLDLWMCLLKQVKREELLSTITMTPIVESSCIALMNNSLASLTLISRRLLNPSLWSLWLGIISVVGLISVLMLLLRREFWFQQLMFKLVNSSTDGCLNWLSSLVKYTQRLWLIYEEEAPKLRSSNSEIPILDRHTSLQTHLKSDSWEWWDRVHKDSYWLRIK